MATATPEEQELQRLAKDSSQGNDFLRLFRDKYVNDTDVAYESGITFTRGEDAYRYFEGLTLEHSGDKAKMIKDITADLKALNGGRDISAAAKTAVENLINNSADAAEFAATVHSGHAGILRDLTAAAGGRNVTYPGYQPYVPVLGMTGYGAFFGHLGGIFNSLMPNALEAAKNQELKTVRDVLGNDPSAATAQGVIDALETHTGLVSGPAGEAALVAEANRVMTSQAWIDERNPGRKAEAIIDALRVIAESNLDVTMKFETIDMSLVQNGGNQYKLADGRVLFDLGERYDTAAELDADREAAGLESVGESVYSAKYFPGMTS